VLFLSFQNFINVSINIVCPFKHPAYVDAVEFESSFHDPINKFG
jgi:hypothetical protein